MIAAIATRRSLEEYVSEYLQALYDLRLENKLKFTQYRNDMENKSTTIEVILSQESVEAIANAMAERMFDLLNGFLIPLKEDLDAIERNTH